MSMANMRRIAFLSAAAMAITGLAGAAPASAQSEAGSTQLVSQQSTRPMNVLFIIADDQNADLGAYGAPVSTPNIDRLAKDGTRFEHAYVQFPLCGPSRASFLSGLRPTTIGSTEIYDLFRCALPNAITMPQYFKQNGYQSVRIGKIFHQGVPNDIGQAGDDDPASWTETFNPRGADKDLEGDVINMTPGLGLGRANAWLAPDRPDSEMTDGKVADLAIGQLREKKNTPFFLAVGFYRPHVPEITPAKYFKGYPAAKMKLANETAGTLAEVPVANTSSNDLNMGMTPEQQRQMIAAYRASTSFVDAQIGRILAELKAQGLDKNTIVVVTGDHGFLLGEHGQWQKNLLWEKATHVPLVIRAPGSRAGQVVHSNVEMIDLYPTLVQMAGLPAKVGLDGRSLQPLIANPARAWDYPAYSQILGGRSIRTARYRYTEWQNGKAGRQLYDYKADPLEHRNLADDPRYAKVVAELKAKLPAGEVEPLGKKNLSNAQGPKPTRQGGRPPVEGCGHLDLTSG